MKIADLYLQHLEREAKTTRRLLEGVPEGKGDWKPHPKSMEMGYLSVLVAMMPSWIAKIVDEESLDLAAGGAAPKPATNRDLVKLFDDSVAAARTALGHANDDMLMKPWKLLVGGRVVDEKPRYAMIGETLTHFAHHRGQLTVYLRLNDKKVTSVYGPTADERW